MKIDLEYAFFSILTPREFDVLNRLINGESNKDTGRLLGISPRTIEVHRARIIEKLQCRNSPEMVKMVLLAHFKVIAPFVFVPRIKPSVELAA